jgi:hypothetical protein
LQLRRHSIELVGERAEFVVARHLDSLVEIPRPDLRRRDLDRLDRTDEPAREEDAGHDGEQEEGDEQERRAPDRRPERRVRLIQWLFDEHAPAERLDGLVGAQHLGSVLVAADRRRLSRGGRCLQRSADLRQLGEARVPQNEVDVGMGDEIAALVDRVCVPGGPDPGTLDDVADGIEVDVRNHDAAAGGTFGHGHGHVRLRPAHEPDRTEVLLVGARADERRPRREVDPAVAHDGCERRSP